jgi:hypothetical protein
MAFRWNRWLFLLLPTMFACGVAFVGGTLDLSAWSVENVRLVGRIESSGELLVVTDEKLARFRFLDPASGRDTREPLVLGSPAPKAEQMAAAFLDGGRRLLFATEGRLVEVDLERRSIRRVEGQPGNFGIAVSPDGAWLASTGGVGSLELTRLADGVRVEVPFSGGRGLTLGLGQRLHAAFLRDPDAAPPSGSPAAGSGWLIAFTELDAVTGKEPPILRVVDVATGKERHRKTLTATGAEPGLPAGSLVGAAWGVMAAEGDQLRLRGSVSLGKGQLSLPWRCTWKGEELRPDPDSATAIGAGETPGTWVRIIDFGRSRDRTLDVTMAGPHPTGVHRLRQMLPGWYPGPWARTTDDVDLTLRDRTGRVVQERLLASLSSGHVAFDDDAIFLTRRTMKGEAVERWDPNNGAARAWWWLALLPGLAASTLLARWTAPNPTATGPVLSSSDGGESAVQEQAGQPV